MPNFYDFIFSIFTWNIYAHVTVILLLLEQKTSCLPVFHHPWKPGAIKGGVFTEMPV